MVDHPWTIELQNLQRQRDKQHSRLQPLSQAFDGGSSRTNIIRFQNELILQLHIRTIADITPYADEPEQHRAHRWTTFIGLHFSVLITLVTDRCRSFVVDMATYQHHVTILSRIRAAFLPTAYNDQLH